MANEYRLYECKTQQNGILLVAYEFENDERDRYCYFWTRSY